MLAVRSLEATTEKYLRDCIRAYFEDRSLKYVLGVIGPATAQARAILGTRFGQYAGTEKYRDLIERLCSSGSSL
jgi:hypothetical protein